MAKKKRKHDRTFTDGYIVGWQSVSMPKALPADPTHAIPAGKTRYKAGYDRGVEHALERVAFLEVMRPN